MKQKERNYKYMIFVVWLLFIIVYGVCNIEENLFLFFKSGKCFSLYWAYFLLTTKKCFSLAYVFLENEMVFGKHFSLK